MKQNKGFTLIELLVVVAIVGLLSVFSFFSLKIAVEKARSVAAREEIRHIVLSLELYFFDNNEEYPCDVARDLPAGLEQYLSTNPRWPKAPWPGSVFDWDFWDPNDVSGCGGELTEAPNTEKVYQVSIRFCEADGSNCRFPMSAWANNFDRYSSAYWCISGPCRAHGGEAYNHPACCIGGLCPEDQPMCAF